MEIVGGKVICIGPCAGEFNFYPFFISDIKKNIPFIIYSGGKDPLTVEMRTREIPFLLKTINPDGSVNIAEKYTYMISLMPSSGSIKEILIDKERIDLDHSEISATKSGIKVVARDWQAEVFYEWTKLEHFTHPYIIKVWDRCEFPDDYKVKKFVVTKEVYDNLIKEGEEVRKNMSAGIDAIIAKAYQEKLEKALKGDTLYLPGGK